VTTLLDWARSDRAGARPERAAPTREQLGPGVVLLRRFTAAAIHLDEIAGVVAEAPFRHMVTPGGFTMSVAMTNCGQAGWVTDRSGYRYSATDPQTGRAWPALPPALDVLAVRAAAAAGFDAFVPDACLINRYVPGARLSLHQDRNERDFSQPIVSVSLGLPAIFRIGGQERRQPLLDVVLEDGDIVVFGGPARLAFHGVKKLAAGTHAVLGACRINLTFRQAL
jgi:alkylated DNA repair protein (DNA oxidative demethylase)